MRRLSIVITALTTLVEPTLAQGANPKRPGTTVIVYDDFQKPGGYTLADYDAKWSINMLGEMAVEDTRHFENHSLSISATPFRTGRDSGVADHGKYLALSKRVFTVPEIGSITVSMDIAAETPGTVPGRVVHGTYVQSGAPYTATVLQGQQAAATLHVIDFATGQLFDWFVSGSTAFPLIERLPSIVTGSAERVSTDKMYTQITREVPIAPGVRIGWRSAIHATDEARAWSTCSTASACPRSSESAFPSTCRASGTPGLTRRADPGSSCGTRSTRSSSPTASSACSTRSRSSTRTRRHSMCPFRCRSVCSVKA